ncbi:MAG: hypothetical protein IPP74_15940 [Alphaproteobacteria bacterium]|nr:hypothetical protein [Alphaproteobacteria bacterium]
MADKKITAWYTANPVTLDPGDIVPVTENTGTTPATGAAKLSQLMFNRYKITPSVSSNDLIIAIKHLDGSDPSTDRPIYFKVGNSIRAVTAALSLTIADGTNTFNMGSPELGGKEQDLFLYVGYRAASSAVVLLCSRVPYANLYSDFSATATVDTYAAFSTAPASTDEVANIGRVAATLSLVATSYLWTVPTYTNKNLIQYPIFNTRQLTWSPVWTNLTVGNGTVTAYYEINMRQCKVFVDIVFGSTSSISGGIAHTTPFARSSVYGSATQQLGVARLLDSGTAGFAGVTQLNSSNSLTIIAQNAGSTYLFTASLSSTVPMTWTTSDSITHEGNYFI